ncbi:MAG: hypothetical protein L3J67_03210 [Hyphomicrobiaceae bacterium]|nr:hypothetical protein [Hyphomicrobiaceae bacterium]
MLIFGFLFGRDFIKEWMEGTDSTLESWLISLGKTGLFFLLIAGALLKLKFQIDIARGDKAMPNIESEVIWCVLASGTLTFILFFLLYKHIGKQRGWF